MHRGPGLSPCSVLSWPPGSHPVSSYLRFLIHERGLSQSPSMASQACLEESWSRDGSGEGGTSQVDAQCNDGWLHGVGFKLMSNIPSVIFYKVY